MDTSLTETGTKVCPSCGNAIEVDKRYVVWCDKCDWNLDPGSETNAGERSGRRASQARDKGERLHIELKKSQLVRPSRSWPRVASFVIAAAIHVTTLAVLAFGIYVVATNFLTFYMFVFGLPLLLLGLLIRPQLGRLDRGSLTLTAAEAPALFELLCRLGKHVGSRPVDVIVLDARFNASHGQIGVRRRRVLWIGLSLWNVLDDQERVGVLAHELADQVNGDLSHGLVVGSALRTLAGWMAVLYAPTRPRQRAGSVFEALEMLGELLASIAMRLMGSLIGALYRLERSLLFQSQQRAEYYADWLAAKAASTDAMVRCLDTFHVARLCTLAVRFAAQRGQPDIWKAERQFLSDLSPREWERLRRLDARQATSIDSTHPPTNLRIELLRQKPLETGSVSMSSAEAAAISAELSRYFDAVADRLAELAA
jgi:Zn-dependent protease with chaperone function